MTLIELLNMRVSYQGVSYPLYRIADIDMYENQLKFSTLEFAARLYSIELSMKKSL